jgi:hypothetical protein
MVKQASPTIVLLLNALSLISPSHFRGDLRN